MIGSSGIAHTDLRPSGKVMINNEMYDATAEAGYIEKKTPVRVVKYSTSQLIVRSI